MAVSLLLSLELESHFWILRNATIVRTETMLIVAISSTRVNAPVLDLVVMFCFLSLV